MLICLLLLLRTELRGADSTLLVKTVSAYPGSTVSVPVCVIGVTNVAGAQFDVSFDPARAVPGTPNVGHSFSNHLVRSREISPGVWRTVVYSMANTAATVTNVGVLARVSFTVPMTERAGSGPLTPANVTLARPNASKIAPLQSVPGEIVINPVRRTANGADFFLPSSPGTNYLIQASTNLIDWITITNITATSDFLDLFDGDAKDYAMRFYRWAVPAAAGQFNLACVQTDGRMSFQLTGPAGRIYVLQASTNLKNWSNVRTNVAADGVIDFNVPVEAGYPYRFFRVKSE